jgi:hypothetical protein
MTPAKTTIVRKKNVTIEEMVDSHDRALFGYTDRATLKTVPGLLEQIREAHADISGLKEDVKEVKETTAGVPEIVLVVKYIKRWGIIGGVALIVGLLLIIFHQYNLIPVLLKAVTP